MKKKSVFCCAIIIATSNLISNKASATCASSVNVSDLAASDGSYTGGKCQLTGVTANLKTQQLLVKCASPDDCNNLCQSRSCGNRNKTTDGTNSCLCTG
jgi:hypothetical protein